MKPLLRMISLSAVLMMIVLGCDTGVGPDVEGPEAAGQAAGKKVSSTGLFAFLPAGEVGGGVLVPGTMYPPTGINTSKIVRTSHFVDFTIQTTGLPEGAYTVWVVTINDPGSCLTAPCTDVDVFGRQDEVDSSVFWSTGGIVGSSGHGYFKGRVYVGVLPSGSGQIGLPGTGLQDPYGAEVHLIVKYHGLPSSDPDVLYDQTHTLLGSCDQGANALDFGPPFGVQCTDPQAAIHQP